ncbi:hypothetical protein FCH28_16365 [Streptomyces piniterrae]|uniref:Mobile element transfer n=1 Tax=Streptomyces piniterrae TaxID=2571125 RepID=A0A4U0NFS6_9ACTN|nr:hypothetical protein [Streptomyces piniterrae]TJZ52763.1 hypothetical protein FCH28_16365 [Streptomyces piniterrae]
MPDRAFRDPSPGHRTFTTERGAFCLARCDCGWTGPARRARSQARTDAERHEAATGPGNT